MSDCLLDTHTLMWAINEPSRLGAGAVEGDAALDRDPGRGEPAAPTAIGAANRVGIGTMYPPPND